MRIAEKLQLSGSTLEDWRWKRLGPPFFRISKGCIRYDEDALEAWVKDRMIQEVSRSN
jgi:hypothetical protein